MADAESAVEEAVGFLQKTSSATGGSLFDHLSDIVSTILKERPHEALDVLETSYILKRAQRRGEDAPVPEYANARGDHVRRMEAYLDLLRDPQPAVDGETGQPVETDPPNEYTCQDVARDSHLFEALGVGLGSAETLAVSLMARRLGEDPALGVQHVRFFGKFFGLQRDYYVFETKLKDGAAAEEGESGEDVPAELGAGANAHVYFTCSAPGDAFERLPEARPEHIRTARALRRFLTGRLEADVSSFPLFPGKEAEYLRAQIARISCATVLCPSGHFALNDDGIVERCEETSPPTTEELKELANWLHLTPHLKRQGRCELHVREAPEGEGEGFELAEDEREEGPALLSTVDRDISPSGTSPWTVIASSSRRNHPHQVVGLRSLTWPGAVSAAQGQLCANVYVGWGLKDAPHELPPFPLIRSEHDAVASSESDAQPTPARSDEPTDEA